jgi:hypothetical protein
LKELRGFQKGEKHSYPEPRPLLSTPSMTSSLLIGLINFYRHFLNCQKCRLQFPTPSPKCSHASTTTHIHHTYTFPTHPYIIHHTHTSHTTYPPHTYHTPHTQRHTHHTHHIHTTHTHTHTHTQDHHTTQVLRMIWHSRHSMIHAFVEFS